MKKLILSLIVFLLLQIGMFWLAVVKVGASGPYAHILALFLLCSVSIMILRHEKVNWKHPYLISFFYSLLAAFAIEVVQYFIPYRNVDVFDILWGLLGIIASILMFRLILKKA